MTCRGWRLRGGFRAIHFGGALADTTFEVFICHPQRGVGTFQLLGGDLQFLHGCLQFFRDMRRRFILISRQ